MFPDYEIRAVTNGIHVPSWTHPAFAELFNRHSADWSELPMDMLRFDQLPPDEVWKAHLCARSDLVALVRRVANSTLDPELPIIGFARRVAAYKRPGLLFSDLERLKAIHARHPFQLVFAGKAHPHDAPAKELIRQIHQAIGALAPELRIAFLPNYDISIAPVVVAGADVWLNTPEPPLEASGTSGMKAAINGVLNLSVLDGWWIEGCIEGVTGWAIGGDASGTHAASAEHLYDKLEHVVLPLYYEHRQRWIWMMQQSISKIGSAFNTHRMMLCYVAEAYLPRHGAQSADMHV